MKFDSEYKKQIDKLCEDVNMPDADEMLRLAKSAAAERTEITMTSKNKKKINRFTWVAAVTAACLTVSAATGYAYTSGGLSELFDRFFHDDVTSSLISEGHVQEIGESIEDDIFTATFIGVAGDKYNPSLVFDIRINDEETAEKYSSLEIEAYVLDEYTYDTYLDNYGTFTCSGIQDENDPALYHVDMSGGWTLVNSKSGVVNICGITLSGKNGVSSYDVNMEYRFAIEENTLKDVANIFLENAYMEYDGIRYQMGTVILDSYETGLDFVYDVTQTPLNDADGDIEAAVAEHWNRFLSDMKIIVDGVEYLPKEEENSSGSYCETGDSKPCTAHMWVDFPAIDYENAENAVVSAYGQEIPLIVDSKFADRSEENVLGYSFLDVETNFEGLDMDVYSISFENAKTEIFIKFKAPEELRELEQGDVETRLEKPWIDFIHTITLHINGEKKEILSSDLLQGVYYEASPDADDRYTCWGNIPFEPTPFNDITEMTLEMNGEEFDLMRDGEMRPYGHDWSTSDTGTDEE